MSNKRLLARFTNPDGTNMITNGRVGGGEKRKFVRNGRSLIQELNEKAPPSRASDDSIVQDRLDKSLRTPRSFGQTKNDATAEHVRRVVEAVDDLASTLKEEWAACEGRKDEELKQFLSNQILAQISLRDLRTTMTALADLVMTSQQKFHATRKVRGVKMPVQQPSTSTESVLLPEKEIKIEPQDDYQCIINQDDYACIIKKEIKEEEDPIEEPLADTFVPLSDTNRGEEVLKLDEPEPEEHVEASLSLGLLFNEDPVSKKRKLSFVPNNVLPFLCHFCNSYDPQSKYSSTPKNPEERRKFLLNLNCATQVERNKREVLLISTRNVYFCGRHVPAGTSEMQLASDMIVTNLSKEKRLQLASRRATIPTRTKKVINPNPTSTPSTSYRLLLVKPPTEYDKL